MFQEFGREIGVAKGIHAHGPGQLAAFGTGHGLALEDQAQLYRDRGGGMVLRQPEDLFLADEVGAAVPHVGDVGDAIADDGRHEGRGHRLALVLAQRSVMHPGAGGDEHAPEGSFGVEFRRGFLEHVQRGVDRQAAGNLTLEESAHAVGEQGDAALLLTHQRILGFPVIDGILVDRTDRTGSGQAGVAQAHGGKTRAPLRRKASGAADEEQLGVDVDGIKRSRRQGVR